MPEKTSEGDDELEAPYKQLMYVFVFADYFFKFCLVVGFLHLIFFSAFPNYMGDLWRRFDNHLDCHQVLMDTPKTDKIDHFERGIYPSFYEPLNEQ